MKRLWLKIAVAVIVVFVLAVVALPFLIDAERFRPEIESELSKAFGRSVEIGKLSFSLLSGGISAQEITIADDPEFSREPFVQAKALDVGVELWPLISSRTLHVNAFTIESPKVALRQSSSGQWNFSTLGSKTPSAGKGASSPQGLSVKKFKISDGTLLVTSGGRTQAYSGLDFEAENVSPTAQFPFTLKATTPGNGNLEVEGKAGPMATNFIETPLQAEATLEGLNLAGYFGEQSGIDGEANMSAKLAAARGAALAVGEVRTAQLRLAKDGTPSRQPITFDFAVDFNLLRNTGRLKRGDLHFGKSVAHLTGDIDLRGDAVLAMKLALQGVPATDLQTLLPPMGITLPAGTSLQSGTVATTLSANGTLDKLVITGPVHATNMRLAGFDLGGKFAGIAALAGIRTGSNTDIQLLDTTIRLAPEGTRLDKINTIVSGVGTITGLGTISPKGALDFHLAVKLSGGGGVLSTLGQAVGVGVNTQNAIPVQVQGTTSNPIFRPDLSGVLQMPQSAAQPGTTTQPQTGLGGLLENLLKKK